jgi:membrane protease YdiL (CAAX protease family)
VKRRLWLNRPQDRTTGEAKPRLWLWLVPVLIGIALLDIVLAPTIDGAWVKVFPFLAEPVGYSFNAVFESRAMLDQLVGDWGFFFLFVVFAVFNTILGEEFLFRGILLPRMEGVFGKWSWVANGVLFGLYHLHQPWTILTNVIGGVLFYALPAWRFRTTWMPIVAHSAQSVYLTFLVLGVVLGLA